MDLRVRCCGLLVLSLFAVFCVSKSVGGDSTTGGRCSVNDSMIPPHLHYIANSDSGTLTVQCRCEDGYLLVPANGSRLTCNSSTALGKFPSCKAIPEVGFTETTTKCKMTKKCEDQNIVVGLTRDFVRNFTVTVELTDPIDFDMEADPDSGDDKPFSLVKTSLLFSGSSNSQEVKVKVKDTKMSGVNQNYTLCLGVLPFEEGGKAETRAVVNQACTVLTVVNDNVAVVSLAQDRVVFTSTTQLLSFQVGYRTCDIHMELCLDPKVDDSKIKRAQEAHVCHNFKILDNKPVVDLVKQNAAFSLEVGQYKGVLSVLDSNGCGANVVKPSLTLIWTLAPEEILEYSGVLFLEDKYAIDVDSSNISSEPFITVHCSSCVAIPVNISFYPQGSPDLTYSMKVAIDSEEPKVDISEFVNKRIEDADVLVEVFTISLSVQTSPLLAMVDDSSKEATLTLSIGASVGFSSNSTLTTKQDETDISISTSRAIRNLNDYVLVSVVDDQQSELEAEYSLSWVSPHNWSLTLTLTAEFEDLGVYTLSLEAKNDDAKKNLEFEEPAFVNIKVHLEFEKTLYTFEEGHEDLEIVITSSRQLEKNKLEQFLKFEPNNILTMNDDVKWEDGKLSVTLAKKNESVTGVDVIVTLTGPEQYVEIPDDSATMTVSIPSPTTPAPAVPTEEENDEGDVGEAVGVGTSWSFGGMIAVLIAAVVVAVVVYVGYSNRQKILSYVGGSGGEEGGGGKSIISKARKRLRSRGAYKKLPTSVQDAMTRHND